MSDPIFTYIDLDGEQMFVGRLWSNIRGRRESATFEYDSAWLESPVRFALEPALTLTPGPFQSTEQKVLFGAIGDSAPDRWGRILMRRANRKQCSAEGHQPRTLFERDYLLQVNDEARQGALRFATESDGPFLATYEGVRIPPLIDLPRLLAASDHVVDDDDTREDLRILLAPGSSLGGTQPKASVRDTDNNLTIAKFPNKNDEYDRVTWEAVALALARKAGIIVPDMRLETIAGRNVLLLRRFDRRGSCRIPFLSGMSMIGSNDNDVRSYLELVDALRKYGANTSRDLHELWSRIVFTVLISNVDDHMRNHGFLYSGYEGWHLSPAYDLNPTPIDISPRTLSTTIGLDDPSASIELAYEVCEYFGISLNQARETANKIGHVVATWRNEARRFGLSKQEMDRMATAFEHEDIEVVLNSF